MKTGYIFQPLLTIALLGFIILGIYHMIGDSYQSDMYRDMMKNQNQVIQSLHDSIDSGGQLESNNEGTSDWSN